MIKRFLLSIKLIIVVSVYSVLGALIFIELEKETDIESKIAARDYHLIARNVFLNSLKLIEQEYNDLELRELHWNQSLEEFETNIGVSLPEVETSWTFSMAILYAGTIYTTIGYGNIACVTTSGRIATIIYAMFGIPLMVIVLNTLNKIFLKKIRLLSACFNDTMLYASVKLGFKKLPQDSPEFQRYQIISKRYAKRNEFPNIDIENQAADTEKSIDNVDNDENSDAEPPVLPSVIAAIAWIFLSAALFCVWEDWTYFTSIYFFFVSLSTIGFGDITPGHPEYMMATFGVVIVGLALLGVCIDVVRERLEQMYFLLLQKLLQEYMERAATGDHEGATKGMMSGFQDKAKFLMPFISKERSAKVMDKFKEKAKEQGIELPAVLTDIDPETGAPAFASAKNEEFTEYIEKAKAKEESLPLKAAKVQTEKNWDISEKMKSASTQFSSALTIDDLSKVDYELLRKVIEAIGPKLLNKAVEATNMTLTSETQTKVPPTYLESNSVSIQAATKLSDDDSQTSDTETINSAIQANVTMKNVIVETIFEQAEKGIQCQKAVKECGIQNTTPVTNHGVQPEVSSLVLFDDENDASDEEESLTVSEPTMVEELVEVETSVAPIEKLKQDDLVLPTLSTAQLQGAAEVQRKQQPKSNVPSSRKQKEEISFYLKNKGSQTNIELSVEETKRELDRLRLHLTQLIGVDSSTSTADQILTSVNTETQVQFEDVKKIQTEISCFAYKIKTNSSVQDEYLKNTSSQVEMLMVSENLQTTILNEMGSVQTEINLSDFAINEGIQTDVSIFDLIFDRPTQTEVSAFDMRFERLTQTDFSLFLSSAEFGTQTDTPIPNFGPKLSEEILPIKNESFAEKLPSVAIVKTSTIEKLSEKAVKDTTQPEGQNSSLLAALLDLSQTKLLEATSRPLSKSQEPSKVSAIVSKTKEFEDKSVGLEIKQSFSSAQTDVATYAEISKSTVETKNEYTEMEDFTESKTKNLAETESDNSEIETKTEELQKDSLSESSASEKDAVEAALKDNGSSSEIMSTDSSSNSDKEETLVPENIAEDRDQLQVIKSAPTSEKCNTQDSESTTNPIITVNTGTNTSDDTITEAVQMPDDLYDRPIPFEQYYFLASDNNIINFQCQKILEAKPASESFSLADSLDKPEVIDAIPETVDLSSITASTRIPEMSDTTLNQSISTEDNQLESVEINNISKTINVQPRESSSLKASAVAFTKNKEKKINVIFAEKSLKIKLTNEYDNLEKVGSDSTLEDVSYNEVKEKVVDEVDAYTQTSVPQPDDNERDTKKIEVNEAAQTITSEATSSTQTDTKALESVTSFKSTSTGIQVMSVDPEQLQLIMKQPLCNTGTETEDGKTLSSFKDAGTNTLLYSDLFKKTETDNINATMETDDNEFSEKPDHYDRQESSTEEQTEAEEDAANVISDETESKKTDAKVQEITSDAVQTTDLYIVKSVGTEPASATNEQMQTQSYAISSSIQAAPEVLNVALQASTALKTRKSQTHISSFHYQEKDDKTQAQKKDESGKKKSRATARVKKSLHWKTKPQETLESSSSSNTLEADGSENGDLTVRSSEENNETETSDYCPIPSSTRVDAKTASDSNIPTKSVGHLTDSPVQEASTLSRTFTMNSNFTRTFESDVSSVSSESVYLNVCLIKAEESEQSNMESDSTDFSNEEYFSEMSSADEETIFYTWDSAVQTQTLNLETIGVQSTPEVDNMRDAVCQFDSSSIEQLENLNTDVAYIKNYDTETPTTSFYSADENLEQTAPEQQQIDSFNEEEEQYSTTALDDLEESTEDVYSSKTDSSLQAKPTTAELASQINPELRSVVTNTEGIQSERFVANKEIDNEQELADKAVQPHVSYLLHKSEASQLLQPEQLESADDEIPNFLMSEATDSADLVLKMNARTQTKVSTANAGNQVMAAVQVKGTQYERKIANKTSQTSKLEMITEGVQFDEEEHQMARHLYMRDIGLQTGVLARVEHIMSPLDLDEAFSQERNKPLEPFQFSQHLKAASTSESLPDSSKRTHSSGEISRFRLTAPHLQQKRTTSESHDLRHQRRESVGHTAITLEKPSGFLPGNKRQQTVADLRHMFDDGSNRDKPNDDKKTLYT